MNNVSVFWLVDDGDFWAAHSREEITQEYFNLFGIQLDQDSLWIVDEDKLNDWKLDEGNTFREELDRLISEGARFPVMFATEWPPY